MVEPPDNPSPGPASEQSDRVPDAIGCSPVESTIQTATRAAVASAARCRSLRLLVLHGSRARNDAQSRSDLDFAYLGDVGLDALALRADLASALRTDALDLADLDRAGALLRFRVARDGVAVFEREEDCFPRFWIDATQFWCDMGPIIRKGGEALLASFEK